jgi:nucleotide-binding universal stress UspA family protein
MSPEDRLNSALNLLFLLAQAYYKILESVVSSATWFCALDLELNESYLWTVTNLKNLLANHDDLRDFPEPFEPIFPDLYPSTIVDVEWQDMVAPEVEKFLSTVQRYTRSKGMHIPEPSTPAWTFVELFRPSAAQAVEQASVYGKRMRDHARKVFGGKADAVGTSNQKTGAVMSSVFISYSWDSDIHREWVRKLAERLRADGVDVSIDRWETVPGDQLPAFMERAIRENKFVIIICTARYKRRSDAREGGVGYEGDIMTGEVLTSQNNRKFIPVLRDGAWQEAAPSWLVGKYYINLTGNPYSERDYEDLVRTLLGVRETAPPIGKPFATINSSAAQHSVSMPEDLPMEFQDIKITRVIVEDITEPRNDGTAGSSLYSIPFALSTSPPPEWEDLFLENWNHPSRFTTMHRPGIASISGATAILDGTTIEEVERYHRDTLQLAVAQTNQQYRDLLRKQNERLTREEARRQEHRKRVENASKRIKFD